MDDGAEAAGRTEASGPYARHRDPTHQPERPAASLGGCVPQAAICGEAPGADARGGGGRGRHKARRKVDRHQPGREPSETGAGLGNAGSRCGAVFLVAVMRIKRLRCFNESRSVEAVAVRGREFSQT